jgi:hypothetical protein
MRLPKSLTRKQRRQVIRIAWVQIERFIKDWQKSPYEFEKERDVQVELVSRIKFALKKHKIYWANFKKYIMKGDEQGQIYSRVCCESAIRYEDNKTRHNICRPDIVIWDNLEKPDSPDDDLWKSGRNPHILWICEIKYLPPWKADDELRKDHWDLDKMKRLLKQKDVEYACWLHINFRRAISGNGYKRNILEKGRLHRYDIKLPSVKQGK